MSLTILPLNSHGHAFTPPIRKLPFDQGVSKGCKVAYVLEGMIFALGIINGVRLRLKCLIGLLINSLREHLQLGSSPNSPAHDLPWQGHLGGCVCSDHSNVRNSAGLFSTWCSPCNLPARCLASRRKTSVSRTLCQLCLRTPVLESCHQS